MAFNVSDFRSQMQFDGARPNLFEVQMDFPTIAALPQATTKMKFMCKSAQLPGSTVGVVDVPYFGRQVKFAGNRTFADWTVTVINDEDFIVRNAFERWMNGINSHASNLRVVGRSPRDYTQTAWVRHFGKTGDTIKQYKFIGMFPQDISAIDLDWGNNDVMEEFTVTLSYQWWETVAEPVSY